MTALLPSWKGFQSRRGPNGSPDKAETSNGNIDIMLSPVRKSADPPSDADVAAVSWVIGNEASISQALIASLFKEYRSLQELYGFTAERKEELMPDIESVDNLRALI